MTVGTPRCDDCETWCVTDFGESWTCPDCGEVVSR